MGKDNEVGRNEGEEEERGRKVEDGEEDGKGRLMEGYK